MRSDFESLEHKIRKIHANTLHRQLQIKSKIIDEAFPPKKGDPSSGVKDNEEDNPNPKDDKTKKKNPKFPDKKDGDEEKKGVEDIPFNDQPPAVGQGDDVPPSGGGAVIKPGIAIKVAKSKQPIDPEFKGDTSETIVNPDVDPAKPDSEDDEDDDTGNAGNDSDTKASSGADNEDKDTKVKKKPVNPDGEKNTENDLNKDGTSLKPEADKKDQAPDSDKEKKLKKKSDTDKNKKDVREEKIINRILGKLNGNKGNKTTC